eukprot:m.84040 g.84040  ORF g.84040 m.84040 type:complete len:414 (+) comp15003_c0_seq1:98-1339(+)
MITLQTTHNITHTKWLMIARKSRAGSVGALGRQAQLVLRKLGAPHQRIDGGEGHAQLLSVVAVARLNHAFHLDGRHVRLQPRPLVEEILHAGAALRDQSREACQSAGPVQHTDHEAHKAAVGGQAALNHSAQDRGVNVAAAKHAAHLLALQLRQLARQDSSQASRACALDNVLLQLDQAQDGDGNLRLCDKHRLVHAVLADSKGVFAKDRHSETVCQRAGDVGAHRLAGLQRADKALAVLRLHRNHLHVWPQGLDGQKNARQQTTATRRHHNGVHIGDLLQNFQTARALPGNDVGVIVTVNVLQAVLDADLLCALLGLAKVCAMQNDVGAKLAAVLHLGHGREFRHDKGDRHAQELSVVRQAERVVAGRGCNHANAALNGCEATKGVAGAALLEAACALEDLLLEVQLHAAHL